MEKKKWIRDVETGDKYALTEDTIIVMGLDKNGCQWFGRMDANRVHVITTKFSPDGTGHVLSPSTEDPWELERREAACVRAINECSVCHFPHGPEIYHACV
jgi:hypothetical protein